MDAGRFVAVGLILGFISKSISQSVIQTTPENHRSVTAYPLCDALRLRRDDGLYCDSWRFSVETNDAGIWSRVPERCVDYVEEYMTGERYRLDSEVVADASLTFAKTVDVTGDGKDGWLFDIDETLLSNAPYYVGHGFGSEEFNEHSFNEWVDLAESPALPASLKLYEELKQLGFTIFLLTGRGEFQRNATQENLLLAGYNSWERLILRGSVDSNKSAIVYKSEKRKELEEEGYTIHGNSGDQWSDLLGFSEARRSFKLPNPMYYIG